MIGEIDEETDSALDLGNIRAEPLNSVVHWKDENALGLCKSLIVQTYLAMWTIFTNCV